ncbi:hypothetical protein E4U55_005918 [Claviceps digitariae]|nr:hypothetical protein E4U55_005918 [Claviceps digitariae]
MADAVQHQDMLLSQSFPVCARPAANAASQDRQAEYHHRCLNAVATDGEKRTALIGFASALDQTGYFFKLEKNKAHANKSSSVQAKSVYIYQIELGYNG